MSITLMCRVWEARDIGPYERLALLSLADHAGEDGRCYPSIRRLCERTGLGERGLQGILKRLVSCGLLVIETSAGRGGANLYLVIAPPAPDAPHPRTPLHLPPHPVHPNLT